jgi:GGDEF domain-containing protein
MHDPKTGLPNHTVARLAAMVRNAIALPIGIGPLKFAITPRIGIGLNPDPGASRAALIAHADAAMYRAKQFRSQYEFFEASMAAGEVSAPSPASAFTQGQAR